MGDQMLEDYFQEYGTITDAFVMKEKDTGTPRGFGFVTFRNIATVEVVMDDYADHSIEGKWVEVRRSGIRGRSTAPRQQTDRSWDQGEPGWSSKRRTEDGWQKSSKGEKR